MRLFSGLNNKAGVAVGCDGTFWLWLQIHPLRAEREERLRMPISTNQVILFNRRSMSHLGRLQ